MKLAFFFLLLFICHLSANAQSQTLWNLNIYDRSGQIVSNALVALTNETIKTCLSGKWFKLIIVEFNEKEPGSFPFKSQLSYEFDGNCLTLGRHNRCDSYVQLSGEANDDAVSGIYRSFGLGWSKELGTFTMSKGSL